MNILVINGPNLNMLGVREPQIYGHATLADLEQKIRVVAKDRNANIEFYQSNHEGDLVDKIQQAYGRFKGIIINAGAYTHTSIAILDALKSVNIATVEVHLSDIAKREEFRKISFISLVAEKVICGKGFDGYIEAFEYLIDKYDN
jgi:3-dehydroquinate dehydratase-2